MNNQHNNKARLIVFVLLPIGLLISSYLLYHYIQLAGSANNSKIDVCSTVFGKGCDAALQSGFSLQFGLPLAAWAIIYYCAIILLLLVPFLFGRSFKSAAGLFLYLLTMGGVLMAILLLTIMLVNRSLFCPLCTLLHLINLGLFFSLKELTGFPAKKIIPGIKEGLHTLFSRRIAEPENRWKLAGFFTILVLMLSLYFGLRILTLQATTEPSMIDARPILAEFQSQPVHPIPITDDDPVNGPAHGHIQLVIFSDFYCPSCKRFSKELEQIISYGKGKYTVVFKNLPLSTTCNPYLEKDLHPSACEAAFAAAAAFQQGKFWAFHDSIFHAEPGEYKDFLHLIARKTGLDLRSFDDYRQSEMAKIKISRDIALAKQLGVDATPTIFLNGRIVTDMRPGVLQFLIDQEMIKLKPVTDTTGKMK